MIRWNRETKHLSASWVVVSVLGAVEGIYGRSAYSGDSICYLNVVRAIARGDWKAAFDPMWTLGYPVLVAGVEALFPKTAEGEWYAIDLLNWLVFLATYGAFRWLILEVASSLGEPQAAEAQKPALTWIACAAFLGYGLCFASPVSRVLPDLLVCGLLVACAAQTLRVRRRRSLTDALALGALLGFGCWIKGAFASYSAMFFLVLVLTSAFEAMPWRL